MPGYDLNDVAANAWRHLDRADRHAGADEIPDALERLSNALDEGRKWFHGVHQANLPPPTRDHEPPFKLVAGHAGMIETSAAIADARPADYPHHIGQTDPDPIRGLTDRTKAAASLLPADEWEVVRLAANNLRRSIRNLGKMRDAAIYVDPGPGPGPRDINAEQVRRAIRYTRRVFRKWRMPGE